MPGAATAERNAPREEQTQESPTHQESQERRNYYLDLAGIDSSLTKKQNVSARHNETAPATLLASPRPLLRHHGHGMSKYRSKPNAKRGSGRFEQQAQQHRHNRSRSHDVAALTEKDFEELNPQCEKAYEAKAEQQATAPSPNEGDLESSLPQPKPSQAMTAVAGPRGAVGLSSPPHTPEKLPMSPLHPKSASTPKGHKVRPVSLPVHIPETVSPHHHRRHRNRERNKRLAMRQVAEWIEREHTSRGGVWAAGACGAEHVVVQKHEHHHVHEHHHHHHYHIYEET